LLRSEEAILNGIPLATAIALALPFGYGIRAVYWVPGILLLALPFRPSSV